ncbi:prepilin-type N-terminal cleavage/methylation domain-containing protein [Poriferisphaera sp. WC338]|uniref:prepilin-type N-terminal cleavage/methylation domain-containing protein n=1 Tax=Poriferisphaera sp. WC338 TaxID=3425129 RepID=UPI003D815EE1
MNRLGLHRQANRGFTLIELLVVISIIALLIGILLPALGAARRTARAAASLSNIRQIGIALSVYNSENKDYYPIHSSALPSANRIDGVKPRWADYLYDFMPSEDVFLSPNLDERELDSGFLKTYWHTVSTTKAYMAARDNAGGTARTPLPPASERAGHGGYGYNFQYFGNARGYINASGVHIGNTSTTPNNTYHARLGVDIKAGSRTVVVGDTAGSRDSNASNDPGQDGSAVYALDPPLGSLNFGSRGNGKSSGDPYYEGGPAENTGTYDENFEYLVRSAPAERNNGAANFTFADGHGEAMSRKDVDDSDGDGIADNGYWNGLGDATKR